MTFKEKTGNTGIVFTDKARCRDCYRCVRACPVKAVRMDEGQASVDESLCILCGKCIRECPQNAKHYRSDTELVRSLLKEKTPVYITVAPSFAAFFKPFEITRLPSALRKSGFAYVTETSAGVEVYNRHANERIKTGRPNILTSCPAFIKYVEIYKPEKSKFVVDVASPLILHAADLKARFGDDIRVVFAGPCIAKKREIRKKEYGGLVDAALTFDELKELLASEHINLSMCEESAFDEISNEVDSLYPLKGGALKSAHEKADEGQAVFTVGGYNEVHEMLDFIDAGSGEMIIEPMFCSMGCIEGVGCQSDRNMFERRAAVYEYSSSKLLARSVESTYPYLSAAVEERPKEKEEYTEAEVKEIMLKMGKFSAEDELDCGSCGYDNCREKARAVLSGKAEIDMCLPWMRRVAEQRSDKTIESSPNGIVIVDARLNIIHMNPAFKRFFHCSDSVYGRNISYIMDPEPFERLKTSEEKILEITVEHNNYNLICHEKLYVLEEGKQYVGIFVDVTKNLMNEKKLDELKAETIHKARELLEHQVNMAQQLAKFLGENAARGEELVESLLKMTTNGRERSKGIWDTYTSK